MIKVSVETVGKKFDNTVVINGVVFNLSDDSAEKVLNIVKLAITKGEGTVAQSETKTSAPKAEKPATKSSKKTSKTTTQKAAEDTKSMFQTAVSRLPKSFNTEITFQDWEANGWKRPEGLKGYEVTLNWKINEEAELVNGPYFEQKWKRTIVNNLLKESGFRFNPSKKGWEVTGKVVSK